MINPLPAEETVEDVRRFQRDGHPLVFLSHGLDDPMIVPDNRGGIERALEHLAEHGHRRIAYLSCETGDGPDRRAAYEAVVRKLGLDADPALIVDAAHERVAGSRAIDQLVESGVEFTAVLASNGGSARGALVRLKELGLSVPDDVALVAFDDFLEALATDPAMTCIHFPVERSAETAIDTLVAMIDAGAEPPPLQTVPTELVLRESCGCAPAYDGEAGERERRALVKQVIEQAEVSRAVSTFAARLLATPQLDMIELGRILLEMLPQVGMTDCILGVYEADGDDPVGWSQVQIDPDRPPSRFRTRTFPPWEHDPDEWWRVYEVNVRGPYLACRAVGRLMTERGGGRIVNVTSGMAWMPIDWDDPSSAYGSSKAAVHRLSELLALQLRRYGIAVFSLDPGLNRTSMTADMPDDSPWTAPECASRMVRSLGTGRYDELAGRFLRAEDDLDALLARRDELASDDLHAIRLRI